MTLRVGLTGASRGLGRAMAEWMLAEGMHVVGVAREARSVRDLLEAHPKRFGAVACDLSAAMDRSGVVSRVVSCLGGLDLWINCAGIADHGPLETMSTAQLRDQMEVNFFAALDLSRQAIAPMRRNESGGQIIQVASTLGIRPAPGTGAYAASKAALLSATQTLALEHAEENIRINAIAFGVMDTDMIKRPRGEKSAEEVRADLEGQHPIGRLGTPKDAIEALQYLLGADYATGTVLTVDGGLLL
ncbi:MAG: SDR family oxidoreductase [Myxococcales bacterium]|nr:SDR family oxidoreductase [Myxococcales bacterium]